MPFGIHKHSNRSKQALSDSAASQGNGTAPSPRSASPLAFAPTTGSASGSASGTGTDETRASQPQTFEHQGGIGVGQRGSQIYSNQGPPDHRYQNTPGGELPSRSQSTRYPSGVNEYPQPQPIHLQSTGSADDLVSDSRRGQHQTNTPPAAPVAEQKKSKSIFDRMRGSTSRSEQKAAQSQSPNNTPSTISRRLSRRHENPPSIRTVQQPSPAEQQRLDWQTAQGSRTHLPSPQEGTEDDVDPYLIRPGQEDIHSAPHSAVQEHHQQQSIRPIQQTESDATDSYDDDRQQFPVPPQHSHQTHHQQSESGSSSHYQLQHHSGHSQQQLNLQDPYRQQNPETVSQLSYDSPVNEQRDEQRPSSQSNNHSPTTYPSQRQEFAARGSSIQGPRPLSQYNQMAPGGQQNRRSADPKQTMQGNQGQPESRDGPPPNYSRQQFPGNPPTTPGLVTQTSTASNYRGGPPQREQFGQAGGGEQGRSTPPPAPADRDVNDAYKELLTKYKKVKGLYFDKTAQVEQLQNTLANQRLSQSRTSLDDSEYMTRFQRLDGAITDLAFAIRKDWRNIPSWLLASCNQDAAKVGKQEMTGVGRACITKFLMDEIFNRTFHPGLDVELSINLKTIERNIRKFSPSLNNQEESDALTSKIVNWRLATLEGLREVLSSPESEVYKRQFSRVCTTNLSAALINHLQEPAPPGIEDSAHMIIELAVSIASNMPLESRDINIFYPMPGEPIQTYVMKIEGGILPLENPGVDLASEADGSSTGSGEKEDSDRDGKSRKEKTKSGILSGLMGGSTSGAGSKKGLQTEVSSEGKKGAPDDGVQKVRFAGFVGVEVRGRQMLGKAPVWAIG